MNRSGLWYLADTGNYVLSDEVRIQELARGEDAIVVHLGSGKAYTCNATATDLLRHLGSVRSIETVIAALRQKYDADREQIESEVKALIREFLACELIVEIDAP